MKKKLMILLIAALFIAMIFSTGCKKSFDITGVWTLNYNWFPISNAPNTDSTVSSMKGAGAAGFAMFTFMGDKKSGTFTTDTYTGTYTVDGNNVRWIFDGSVTTYVGTSSDDNTMSGTMTSSSLSGTWSATR